MHTTPATIESVRQILARIAPRLIVHNYLDDSILPQINREGRISEAIAYRFFSLVQGAALAAPDAMLCACSSVGELVERARPMLRMPFLRIDDPMAAQVARSSGRAVVVATLPSTLKPTTAVIAREIACAGSDLVLESLLIEGAGELLTRGDLTGYEALLQSNFLRIAEDADMLVLAQASMARAVQGLPPAVQAKCITSPESGLAALAEVVQRAADKNKHTGDASKGEAL